MTALALIPLAATSAQPLTAAGTKNLRIIVFDEDGGAAALFVTPEGKSLLIDAGWPPSAGNARSGAPATAPVTTSADRIAAAAEALGVKRIDYLLMTHYHVDHLGGLDSLLKKMSVDTFIDHGPNREEIPENATAREVAIAPATNYPEWPAAYQGHRHIKARVGQTIRIGSLQLKFVSSDGQVLRTPLQGAGRPNPLCAGVPTLDRNGGEENVRSLGMLMNFGKTSILDLGDLTWNKELELLCPENRIGKVDVYFVTGHGMDISNSPPTAALNPLVAVMQNGARKGDDEQVIKTLGTYPDLEGLWRNHASVRIPQLNGDPNYIANLAQQPDRAFSIEMSITPGGAITVTNDRNQFSKTYFARASSH